ncbi:MAG: hypothetical protein J1E03_02890 [Acetatifactor sp.]|nr:hypothetical protein [Acetatifactor sp.]
MHNLMLRETIFVVLFLILGLVLRVDGIAVQHVLASVYDYFGGSRHKSMLQFP